MDQHFHPIIYARLQQLFAAADWDALIAYLDSLSNAQFRTAGYLIGERLLAPLPPDVFWHVMLRLILWQPKAFTVTLAKAATPRLLDGSLSLNDAGFCRLTASLSSDQHLIDREKLLRQWLPDIQQPTMIEHLFDLLHVNDTHRRIEFLLHTNSLPAAFVLLRTLRFEEHDRPYLTDVCQYIIRRAAQQDASTTHPDNYSFNLASLLRSFFDLPNIHGTFSLTIKPYELSRLDTDFEVFKRILTKV